MEEPLQEFEDPNPVLNLHPAPRQDPLYRTHHTIYTTHEETQRDLQVNHEEAQFDEDGYLNRILGQEFRFLECGCTFTGNNMAGKCSFCHPYSRLCKEHLSRCRKCKRPTCGRHTTSLTNPWTGESCDYCTRHRLRAWLKHYLSISLYAVLHPLVTRDHRR